MAAIDYLDHMIDYHDRLKQKKEKKNSNVKHIKLSDIIRHDRDCVLQGQC